MPISANFIVWIKGIRSPSSLETLSLPGLPAASNASVGMGITYFHKMIFVLFGTLIISIRFSTIFESVDYGYFYIPAFVCNFNFLYTFKASYSA